DTSISFNVLAKNPTINFNPIPVKTFGDPEFTLSASSSTGANITYASDNASVAVINGDKVIIKGVGTATIIASTSNPASSMTQTLTVRKATQTITVGPIGDKRIADLPFKPLVSSTSKLEVFNYSLVSGPATVTLGGLVTPSNSISGTVIIKITQPGDDNYLSKDTTFSFLVKGKVILSNSKLPTISSNATNGILVTLVPDAPSTALVTFCYSKITEASWNEEPVESNGKVYNPSLDGKLDEIGLNYYFKVSYLENGVSKEERTNAATVHVQYNNGLNLPAINGGSVVENYQIVSVSLELDKSGKEVGNVFDELGAYDKKKWRLFRYLTKEDTNKELSLTDTVSPGAGYWLISRNPVTINTGKGTAVRVTNDSPFSFKLKKGYNQIGNPYNFAISWADVMEANGTPADVDSEVKIFTQGGWKDATTIKAFEGAYIWTEKDIEIKIPTVKPDQSKLKRSVAREEGQGWRLDLSVSDKEGFETKGAVGMNAGADLSKDAYDGITLPRFMKYLEINFNHPEYFAPKFSRDIVPADKNHIWNFTVETNLDKPVLGIDWDLVTCKAQSEEFYLLDKKAGVAINMKEQGSYAFPNNGTRDLALYYGDKTFIERSLNSEETFINEPFPNPFSETTKVGYSLANSSEAYEVELSIYNMVMEQVTVLEKFTTKSGYYQTEWNGLDASGNRVSPGMYFVRMKASSGKNHSEWLKKIIVK
ncbi:MAG TPA: FlgD immunoglobulin-like domain containing protein, partial [Cytophagaceae bacterium]